MEQQSKENLMDTSSEDGKPSLQDAALIYHRAQHPLDSAGKIAITLTRPMRDMKDMSLAYSPGVAYPCLEIKQDPITVYDYTAKGNLVAVITNGTAVLGLGNIGALAGKPVMEGKAMLFKRLAGIDAFDIEIDEADPDKLIHIIATLHPTFGGINLEDIKAPECFYIERTLRSRLPIPVFHDDQHGTAIVVAAGLLNALRLNGKSLQDVKLVCSGAGAAANACLEILLSLGLPQEHILVFDSKGVIYVGRGLPGDNGEKARWARETEARTVMDAIEGADIFLGLSGPGLLTPEMVKLMNPAPLIFALSNPEPEIRPEKVYQVSPRAIVATGRSDYPNQINNAICFPYLFRAALDVGAHQINEAMKLAAVHALASLASSDISFGVDSIVPSIIDKRLLTTVSLEVAKAAVDSGNARIKHFDEDAYTAKLHRLSQQLSNT